MQEAATHNKSNRASVLNSQRSDADLVDILLTIENDSLDKSHLIDTLTADDAESISPWQPFVPSPKYVLRKKKRTVNEGAQLSGRGRRVGIKVNQGVARNVRVDDSSLWRKCVEPHTYRYIANNGNYRMAKLYGKHPSRHEPKTVITAEQKLLQREIQRALQNEFRQNDRGMEAIDDPITEAKTHSNTVSPLGQQFVASTHKMRSSLPTEPTFKLPPIDVPLVYNYCDSTDIEQFKRRIHSLEREMQGDFCLYKVSNEAMQSKFPIPLFPKRKKDTHTDTSSPDKQFSTQQEHYKFNSKRMKPLADQGDLQNTSSFLHNDIAGFTDFARESVTSFRPEGQSLYCTKNVNPNRHSFHHIQLHKNSGLASKTLKYLKPLRSQKTAKMGDSLINNSIYLNGFTDIPLKKSPQKHNKHINSEVFEPEIISGVSGTKVKVSLVNHRLL